MERDFPTLLHVTHWKAGSQWIHRILRDCFGEYIVPPALGNVQFIGQRILPGRVYPTLYVTREEFNTAILPERWYRFVVVRDLRDTLVSGYFSIRFSHPPIGTIPQWRNQLSKMSLEEGLLFLMEEWLPASAAIQQSWLDAGESLIRYEDLLIRDIEILKRIILEEAKMPVEESFLERVILRNRFENVTGGRRPGQERVDAHERKGIAGDWKNYFTPLVKEIFKKKFGHLLIATGYEKHNEW